MQKPDKPLTTPPTVDGEQIKKKSEQVAIGQILNQAAAIQDRISTKETPVERINKLTQTPPTNSSLPEAPLKQNIAAPPKTTAKQSPEPVVTKKKGGKLDPIALAESLKNPTSEWGKKEVPPKQPEQQKSVAPFEPGTYPGVDKWQPGKGAIDNKTAMKIREKVQNMPDGFPPTETKPAIEENKTTLSPIPQEKVKEPA